MENNIQLYSAMQEDKPIRSWIKTILGKVYIVAWDDMTDQPTGLLLEGDPKHLEDNSYIKIWSTKGDIFFKNMNKMLISRGILKEIDLSTISQEPDENDISNEELTEMLALDKKFMAFQAKLNKFKTAPVLFRLLALAKELEKSDKILASIESRISEIQSAE